jgi:hypothetical protein
MLRALAQLTFLFCRPSIEFIEAVAVAGKSARLTPGNQAHTAPPPLTFGLPGKQMVKPGGPGPVLTRVLKRLRQNPHDFRDCGGGTERNYLQAYLIASAI